MDSLKDIHIGKIIFTAFSESNLTEDFICEKIKCSSDELQQIYSEKNIDCLMLLQFSKLFRYDFFRIYSYHLCLYSAHSKKNPSDQKADNRLYVRKNFYSMEIIQFILGLIADGTKTKEQITEDYRIPTTTLHKWIKKYKR